MRENIRSFSKIYKIKYFGSITKSIEKTLINSDQYVFITLQNGLVVQIYQVTLTIFSGMLPGDFSHNLVCV